METPTCMKEGCGTAAPHRCAACGSARYCGRACQRADWRRHRRQCGAGTDAGAKAISPFWAVAAGGNGDWHRHLASSRVFERLIMSFMLRVDDEYVFNGDLCGTYLAQRDNLGKNYTRKKFKSYLTKAKNKNLLPENWNEEMKKQCLMKAEDGGIHFAMEKSDVVEKFGFDSYEHMVLRSLAQHILGPINDQVKLPTDFLQSEGLPKYCSVLSLN